MQPVVGAFTSRDRKVISWNGENYYQSCGEFVADLPDGGESSCLKRVGHPSPEHEDYDGRVRRTFKYDYSELSVEEAVACALADVSNIARDIPMTIALDLRRAIREALLKRLLEAGSN